MAKKKEIEIEESEVLPKRPKVKIPKIKFSLKKALLFIIVVGILYLARSLFVAALVNNEPITRVEILTQLEKRQGADLLESVINQKLILQEARRQNIDVSKEEVSAEISKLEESVKAQGNDLNTLLASEGLSRADLEEQIKIQKIVEKILAKDITISDEEVDKYLKDSKDFLPKDASEDELKTQAKEQLMNQKISEKFYSWVQELKNKAKIIKFVSY
jgi:parvulin-like peptidyl-prolyl isomerase